MDEEHVDLLDSHRFQLVRDMHPDDVVDHLRSHKIFNQHHSTEIMKKTEDKDKNRILLDRLRECGPNAFDAFINALKETGQHTLAKLLGGNSASGSGSSSIAHSSAAGGEAKGDEPQSDAEVAVISILQSKTETELKKALTRNLVIACQGMDPMEVCDYLVANATMTKVNQEVINSKQTNYQRNQALCDYVGRKDKSEFIHFVKSLFSSGQGHLARKFAE